MTTDLTLLNNDSHDEDRSDEEDVHNHNHEDHEINVESRPKKPLTDEWRSWLRLHLARGFQRDELYEKCVIDHGFDEMEVLEALDRHDREMMEEEQESNKQEEKEEDANENGNGNGNDSNVNENDSNGNGNVHGDSKNNDDTKEKEEKNNDNADSIGSGSVENGNVSASGDNADSNGNDDTKDEEEKITRRPQEKATNGGKQCFSLHCTVCSIPLGVEEPSNNKTADGQNDENDESPVLTSFVTLACAAQCHKNKDNNKKDDKIEDPYSYYCVPDCWEHFLQFQWGIYSGLGLAHQGFERGLLGKACERCRADMVVVTPDDTTVSNLPKGSLTLEQSLTRISPSIMAKTLTIFQQATMDKLQQPQNSSITNDSENDNSNTNDITEEQIRRITQDLEEQRLLQCPSCHVKISIPENRGCDAAWCEHCGRALCLYCLTDCGDHPKTDPTAASSYLIGDAHEHVMNNDCGWTAGKGIVHSGKTLTRHHERQFLHKVALRLKRVPEPIRTAVCRNLQIEPESLPEHDHDSNSDHPPHHHRRQSLTELRRQMENDKWVQYSKDMRENFLHAAYKGDLPMVKCLLEAGIPPPIPDAVGGETALHFAAVFGNAEVIRILLETGRANPWQVSPPGRTPLDDLCNLKSACDLDSARYLVRACMVTAVAVRVGEHDKIVYPWNRPWPNGFTSLASAKLYHPDSPVSAYFEALQHFSFRLCKACTEGEIEEVKLVLSNTTTQFPRPRETDETMQRLPPAQDLIWIYNEGSGCAALLDLCAKSTFVTPQHILLTAKRILEAVSKQASDMLNPVKVMLQMRDFKHRATVLHWLALDDRPAILQVAGLFLQHAGTALARSVDKQGQTPMEWARKFVKATDEDNNSEERQRHIERWEAIMLAWEEEP